MSYESNPEGQQKDSTASFAAANAQGQKRVAAEEMDGAERIHWLLIDAGIFLAFSKSMKWPRERSP